MSVCLCAQLDSLYTLIEFRQTLFPSVFQCFNLISKKRQRHELIML